MESLAEKESEKKQVQEEAEVHLELNNGTREQIKHQVGPILNRGP